MCVRRQWGITVKHETFQMRHPTIGEGGDALLPCNVIFEWGYAKQEMPCVLYCIPCNILSKKQELMPSRHRLFMWCYVHVQSATHLYWGVYRAM